MWPQQYPLTVHSSNTLKNEVIVLDKCWRLKITLVTVCSESDCLTLTVHYWAVGCWQCFNFGRPAFFIKALLESGARAPTSKYRKEEKKTEKIESQPNVITITKNSNSSPLLLNILSVSGQWFVLALALVFSVLNGILFVCVMFQSHKLPKIARCNWVRIEKKIQNRNLMWRLKGSKMCKVQKLTNRILTWSIIKNVYRQCQPFKCIEIWRKKIRKIVSIHRSFSSANCAFAKRPKYAHHSNQRIVL